MLNIIMTMQGKYPFLSFSILDEILAYHLFVMQDNLIRRARVSGYVIGLLESYLMNHPEIPDSVTVMDILADLSETVDGYIGKLDEKFPA